MSGSETGGASQDVSESCGASIAIFGAGAAGRAIAQALAQALPDRRVSLWARREESLVDLDSGVVPTVDFVEAAGADVSILAVSDPAVPSVAEQLAAYAPSGRVVLHLAGALGPEALEPLGRSGCETGGMHPLLALGPHTEPGAFGGALFSIAGSPAALTVAGELARALGGAPVQLEPSARLRYHAAAALVAQGAVALVHVARGEIAGGLGTAPGLDPARAREGLASLLRSVAANLASGEPRDVLTGPIARQDTDTVRAHREVGGADSAALQDLILRVLLPLVRG